MTRLDLFPAEANGTTDVLVVNFGGDDEMYALRVLAQLRAAGISAEIYPEAAKMKKQMGYADKRGVRFVALCGENERNANTIALKDMAKGEQNVVSVADAVSIIKG